MVDDKTHIYIIAGEASGDNLGAKLMHALKAECGQEDIVFSGIGGMQMEEEGLKSLFPMQELAIMGFIELLPHIFKLLFRIWQTKRDIKQKRPDIIVTIDTPGFSFRIAKGVKKLGIPLVHYVAPSVWAYRPKRAEKVAKLYDHLFTLLPFEPPYFKEVGLDCTFVGHPIVEDQLPSANDFRQRYGIDTSREILCVMPGSRKGELSLILPEFMQTLHNIAQRKPDILVVIPTLPAYTTWVESYVQDLPLKTIIVANKEEKQAAFATANTALVKSGTGTLELARANVPMVVGYKVKPFTAWMMRKLLQVKYVSIVNILLDKMLIPECLQEACNTEELTKHLLPLLQNKTKRQAQQKGFAQALKKLGFGQEPTPSQKAAKKVLELITK